MSTPAHTQPKKTQTSPLLLVARYLSQIHEKVQKNWDIKKLPMMALHKRSATITLWVDAKGKLKKVRIVKASGLKIFDHSLLKAIYRASPFPKPNPKILQDVQQNGIDIVFRRRMFKRKLKPLKLKYKSQKKLGYWTPGKPKKRKK